MSDRQIDALKLLRTRGALPNGSYTLPRWAFEFETVTGRDMNSLVRRGLATRHVGFRNIPTWRLTEAGLEAAMAEIRLVDRIVLSATQEDALRACVAGYTLPDVTFGTGYVVAGRLRTLRSLDRLGLITFDDQWVATEAGKAYLEQSESESR